MTQENTIAGNPIVARAGTYYRNARYLMFAMIFGGGLWFAYDGFYRWPKDEAERRGLVKQADDLERTGQLEAAKAARDKANTFKPHSDFDIQLQQILGMVLPPVGLGLLAFWLYRSRGEVRLADETLYVPGHDPIPLSNVTAVDTTLWERKGIAQVEYLDGGEPGKFTLDDFVYQRKPIDEIYDILVKRLAPEAEEAIPESDSPAGKSPEEA